jgi:hypothetical protein
MEDGARQQDSVRAADGRIYVLSDAAENALPLASKRQSTFRSPREPDPPHHGSAIFGGDCRRFPRQFAAVTQ